MAEVKNMLHKVQHLFLSTSVSAQSWRGEGADTRTQGDRNREERQIKTRKRDSLLFFSLSLSHTANQIFMHLPGFGLWLRPVTVAGSLLMMWTSDFPEDRVNINKQTT